MSETDRIVQAYQHLAEHGRSRWDLSNPGNRFILAERERLIRRVLMRAGWVPLNDRRVLDVGSGGGGPMASLQKLGAQPSNLVGVDLLPDRVEAARRAFPELDFRLGNAERLDFPDASFDLVLTFTVFSSIFDGAMAANIAAEIDRVLRPGGALLWYDFRYNNPSNRDVHGVSAGRVRELFPRVEGELVSLTLLPPLARRLGPLTPIAYPGLAWLPPLRTHLLGLLIKPAAPGARP